MRNPGRLVAPIAIAAVAVGTFLIVQSNVGNHPASAVHTTERPVRGATRRTRTRPRAPRYYTVRADDTLSEIARRTRVSLARLEALNPSLDPAALRVGQRVRLRR